MTSKHRKLWHKIYYSLTTINTGTYEGFYPLPVAATEENVSSLPSDHRPGRRGVL